MELSGKETLDGKLGSDDVESILSNYTKELEEFAETINIYESLSAVLAESKIDELSHLCCQELENSLRELPKPPSFQLRTQIFNSIQKTNEETKDKIKAAQRQYESALTALKSLLELAVFKIVRGIVSGNKEEKSAEILYSEAIEFQILTRGLDPLDQKNKTSVQKMLKDDTAELLSAMTLVEEALTTYRKEMTNHFKLYRCMSCEVFSALHIQAEMTAKAKFNSDSSQFFVQFANGLNQMHEIFSGMNELIIKSENILVLKMNQREPRIVNFYKEMMKNEKLEDYKIPAVQLKETEVNEDVKLVKVKKLSVDNLVVAAAKAVYNQRRIYNSKMEECLKKSGGMMDTYQLKKHHDSYSTDARNTILFELKKIEGLGSHLNCAEALKRKIESDWLQLMTVNNKKLGLKEIMKGEVKKNKKSEEEVPEENVLETQQHPNPKIINMSVPKRVYKEYTTPIQLKRH